MSALFTAEGGEYRYPNGKRAWKCDHCGAVSAWTNSWVYFGTIDPSDSVLSFCCQEHGDEHERALPQLFAQRQPKRNRRRA